MAVRYENKVFWPAMLALTVIVVFRHRERLSRASFPPNIICLFLYLGFAGFSVLWAFRPELSSIRFAQQVMIVLSVVLPAMMAVRTADILRGLFLCFAFACILSFFFALGAHAADRGQSGRRIYRTLSEQELSGGMCRPCNYTFALRDAPPRVPARVRDGNRGHCRAASLLGKFENRNGSHAPCADPGCMRIGPATGIRSVAAHNSGAALAPVCGIDTRIELRRLPDFLLFVWGIDVHRPQDAYGIS